MGTRGKRRRVVSSEAVYVDRGRWKVTSVLDCGHVVTTHRPRSRKGETATVGYCVNCAAMEVGR